MARRIRFWPKKRGQRSTVAPSDGVFGEGAFFSAMLLISFFALCALGASRVVNVPSISELTATRFWALMFILSALIVTGAVGIFRIVFSVRTSAERRSVIANKTAAIQQRIEGRPQAGDYPTIPDNTNLTNSPGTELKYRLPLVAAPAWNLLVLGLFCLLWLAALAAVLAVVTKSFLAGSPRWFLLVVTFLLAAVTVRVIQQFILQLRQTIRIGPSHVEVSDLPLYAGQRYEVYVSQAGRMRLSSIKLSLVCDELATYREGTNVRHEKRRVIERTVLEKHAVEVTPREPFSHTGELVIPQDAMHSFQAESNSVKWSLLVSGEIIRGARFQREFPVLIYPRVA